MKKYTVIAITIVGILLGFFTGLYLYKINSIDNTKGEIIAETVEDDNTLITQTNNKELSKVQQTSNQQEKTSPNCNITLKVYYKTCKHLLEKRKNIGEAEVNLTEEELKQKFSDWEVQKFTANEIVLYKEVNEFCNEHFLLKEENGYIAIYKLDENENVEFLKTTEISTEYLAPKDLEQVKVGIKIFTEKELNKTLEDFE